MRREVSAWRVVALVTSRAMQKSDFNYQLPEGLIAQAPPATRGDSRLLHLEGNSGQVADHHFREFLEFLRSDDLLVFNNTRVIPARLHGEKSTGGKVEVLVERVLDERRVLAHVRASKSPKVGALLILEGALQATMLGRHDTLFELDFGAADENIAERLEVHGHMPLPPYIERSDTADDRDRYQTVFAETPGAVAAPTAGLHFTDELLAELKQREIATAFVTLHVGAGTFQPVRAENLDDHDMHSEWLQVEQAVVDAVAACRARGGRVIAIGTTAVRSLESAAVSGELLPMAGDTQLFIRPGYEFQVVDAMVTNFHLPESTLLMLVSAFAGYQNTMAAYRHAIDQKYRFFSYGDAMFIEKRVLSDD